MFLSLNKIVFIYVSKKDSQTQVLIFECWLLFSFLFLPHIWAIKWHCMLAASLIFGEEVQSMEIWAHKNILPCPYSPAHHQLETCPCSSHFRTVWVVTLLFLENLNMWVKDLFVSHSHNVVSSVWTPRLIMGRIGITLVLWGQPVKHIQQNIVI